ncbi:uncharacterized protein TNCV_1110711 [Trichonephila clavipes]|nr:uncharacterized protein TNCV_1110711 [Trichonephila clavipes]
MAKYAAHYRIVRPEYNNNISVLLYLKKYSDYGSYSLTLTEDNLKQQHESYWLNKRFYLGIWNVKTVLNPISGQVFDAGHDESGVFLSAEWHDGNWLVDGIREAWLRCFFWVESYW